MDDDRRHQEWAIQRALAEATLERTAAIEVERRDTTGEPDAMARWEASRPEPEPPKPERGLDTMPPAERTDLVYKIHDTTSAAELDQPDSDSGLGPQLDDFLREVLAGAFAQERRATVELSDQVHDLRLEVAKLTNELATLREARAAERAAALDLPNPLSRRVVN